jgi:hypothetical protein
MIPIVGRGKNSVVEKRLHVHKKYDHTTSGTLILIQEIVKTPLFNGTLTCHSLSWQTFTSWGSAWTAQIHLVQVAHFASLIRGYDEGTFHWQARKKWNIFCLSQYIQSHISRSVKSRKPPYIHSWMHVSCYFDLRADHLAPCEIWCKRCPQSLWHAHITSTYPVLHYHPRAPELRACKTLSAKSCRTSSAVDLSRIDCHRHGDLVKLSVRAWTSTRTGVQCACGNRRWLKEQISSGTDSSTKNLRVLGSGPSIVGTAAEFPSC